MSNQTVHEADGRSPSPDQLAGIAHNVHIVQDMLKEQPSREGVALLDGFIERNWRSAAPDKRPMLAQTSGCYLGASLIAEAGGAWVVEDGGLGVRLAPKFVAFPLSKAQKHWTWGAQDSVLSFFDFALNKLAERRGGSRA